MKEGIYILRKLEAEGVGVLTATHTFDGVNKLTDLGSIDQIVRDTLRNFYQGVKVVVEIAAMAVDTGLVRTDEDIIDIEMQRGITIV